MTKFIKSWTAFTRDSKVGKAIMENIEKSQKEKEDND